MCEKHTCPLAAEFIFDIICLMSEEFNDFIFVLLNNCFTLEKKVKKTTIATSCTIHSISCKICGCALRKNLLVQTVCLPVLIMNNKVIVMQGHSNKHTMMHLVFLDCTEWLHTKNCTHCKF